VNMGELHVLYFIVLALVASRLLGGVRAGGRMPTLGTIAVAAMGFVGYNIRWAGSQPPGVIAPAVAFSAGVLIWAGLKSGLPGRVLRSRAAGTSPSGATAARSSGDGGSGLPVASPEFGEMSLREVMTPKAMIAGVGQGSSASDAVQVAVSSGHSRLVVYEGDLDHIVGVVDVHGLLSAFGGSPRIDRLIRPAMVVPECKRCFGMLEHFLREREQFAVVVDEFGGTAGVITVEDLLDELVGEMADEHERDLAPVRRMPDGSYRVPGHMKVDEINRRLLLKIPEGGYETVSGYVLEKLGRVPARGEKLLLDDATLEIAASTARRIVTVKVVKRDKVARSAGGHPAAH
jgi:Mg2+/Co2+ transporter CorC